MVPWEVKTAMLQTKVVWAIIEMKSEYLRTGRYFQGITFRDQHNHGSRFTSLTACWHLSILKEMKIYFISDRISDLRVAGYLSICRLNSVLSTMQGGCSLRLHPGPRMHMPDYAFDIHSHSLYLGCRTKPELLSMNQLTYLLLHLSFVPDIGSLSPCSADPYIANVTKHWRNSDFTSNIMN